MAEPTKVIFFFSKMSSLLKYENDFYKSSQNYLLFLFISIYGLSKINLRVYGNLVIFLLQCPFTLFIHEKQLNKKEFFFFLNHEKTPLIKAITSLYLISLNLKLAMIYPNFQCQRYTLDKSKAYLSINVFSPVTCVFMM